jgi:hypothetical protein
LSGIVNVIDRPDLSDRSIALRLDYIAPSKRKTEAEFEREFELQRPLILGAVYDLVAHTLKKLPDVRPPNLSRMADFNRVAVACESGFVKAGAFEAAYAASCNEATRTVVEEEPTGVVLAVFSFMQARKIPWRGTATELLVELTRTDRTEEQVTTAKGWPREARGFGKALKRVTSTVRKLGVEIIYGEHANHRQPQVIEVRLETPEGGQADRRRSEKENTGRNGEAPIAYSSTRAAGSDFLIKRKKK